MGKIKYMVAAAVIMQPLAFAATPAFAGVVNTTTTGTQIAPSTASQVAECTKVLAGHPAAARFYATASSLSYTEVVNPPVESEHVFETLSGGGEQTGLTLFGPYKNAGAADSAEPTAEPAAKVTPGNGRGNDGGNNGGGGSSGGSNAGNGGNLNLFAQDFYTLETLPEVKETWNVAVTTDYTAVFHCDIRNKTGNLAGAEWQVFDKSLAAGSVTVTSFYEQINGGGTQAIEPVAADDAYLICNRPHESWEAKNGYAGELGECSNALFDSVTDVLNDI